MIGLQFNGKHSWNDYGLFLSEPPDFGNPEPKISTVDIPGRDSVLDFSEAAAGEIKYSNRQMRFAFAVMVDPEHRDALMSEIRNDLHGKKVEVIYDLDPEWYYTGRATVAFENVMSWKMRVIVSVDAQPYKLAQNQTVVTVSPSSFTAEDIFLGKGTTQQNINSIFEFGTKKNPQLDLTQFSKLKFRWQDPESWGTAALQITDGDGVSFNSTLPNDVIGTGFYGYDLNVSDITTITKSRVYRILCQGRSLVELTGTTTASASVEVIVDRMSVCPMWSSTAAVTAFINGRKFSIPSGGSQNYNIRLTEGTNQVSLISDSSGKTVELYFHNGRL